jgi:hypothetical protein
VQRGNGHKTELVLQVDGHGYRLKFRTLSTGSDSIMRSIGMLDVLCCCIPFALKISSFFLN